VNLLRIKTAIKVFFRDLPRKFKERVQTGFHEQGFRAKVPDPNDHLGKTFKIREQNGIEVVAKRIQTMQVRPTHYLINEHYPISILDFYHQVDGLEVDPLMLELFNQQTFEVGTMEVPNVH
jgi:hypothetical protein